MMMVPYMLHDALFDDWFQDDWDRDFDRMMQAADPRNTFGKRSAHVMKTDVRETAAGYEMFVDLPGFKKEDVKLDLKNGYLTITASRSQDHDEQDNKGRYIRQERYSGSCSRSFYVGDIQPEDIHAKYEDGILKLTLPKADQKAIEHQNRIAIQ